MRGVRVQLELFNASLDVLVKGQKLESNSGRVRTKKTKKRRIKNQIKLRGLKRKGQDKTRDEVELFKEVKDTHTKKQQIK